jgi:hypothetical protein
MKGALCIIYGVLMMLMSILSLLFIVDLWTEYGLSMGSIFGTIISVFAVVCLIHILGSEIKDLWNSDDGW